MRKLQVLLLGAAVLSMGLVLPNQVRAADRDDPVDVFAEYARAIVSVTFRGADAMDDAAATPTPVSGTRTNALHSGATSACGRVARTEGGRVLMLLSYAGWVGGTEKQSAP